MLRGASEQSVYAICTILLLAAREKEGVPNSVQHKEKTMHSASSVNECREHINPMTVEEGLDD